MRKVLVIASALLALGSLSACSDNGQMRPDPSKPAASCFPGVPQVRSATVKAGSDITVTGPGADCAVLFTTKDRTVQLDLRAGQTVLASTSVKADARGGYTAKLHVPSSQAPTSAQVALSAGYRFTCDDTGSGAGSCAAPVALLKITR